MANNRMYLINKRTQARVFLAKYYPSTGWFTTDGLELKLNKAFDAADFGHLTPEERTVKEKTIGFGPPFAAGGMYGAEWVLEYDVDEA